MNVKEKIKIIVNVQRVKTYKSCHSEEANLEIYYLVGNSRPTKNLSFPKARSVFLPFALN